MFEIKEANSGDFERLKLLILEALKEDPIAFTVTFDEYNQGSNSWWHSFLDPYLLQDHSKLYIAKNKDTITGMIGVLFSRRSKQEHIATIVWFYVSKEFRGNKVGNALFEKLLNDISDIKRIKKITLNVTATQKEAQKIYTKYGFTVVGVLKNDLRENDTYHDIVVMEKYIRNPHPNEQSE